MAYEVPTDRVLGYRQLTPEEIKAVNENKIEEARVLQRVGNIGTMSLPALDQRWLAIAKTHFQEAYMALNRAILNPAGLTLDSEGNPQETPPA